MKRGRGTAVALTAAAAATLILGGLIFFVQAAASEPVFSVAQVRTGLAHNLRSWLGRTILVEGAWQGSYHLDVCTAAGSCHRGARWILVKPAEGANLPAPYNLPVGMMSVGVSSNGASSSVSGEEMLTPVLAPSLGPHVMSLQEASTLTIVLPPSIKDVDWPGRQQSLLDALRTAPLVGRFFAALLPRNNRLRLHVRITPRSCSPQAFVVCFDGVLVP